MTNWQPTPPTGAVAHDAAGGAPAVSTRGATISLWLGVVAAILGFVPMIVGTFLSGHLPPLVYAGLILVSLAGGGLGIGALVAGLIARAGLRRQGSEDARGRALGGIILGISAIISPFLGFFLGVFASILSGH